MAKLPIGRILPDLRNPGFASEEERLRIEGIFGPKIKSAWELKREAHEKWLKETPEGRAEHQSMIDAIKQVDEYDAELIRIKAESRETRMLNGDPAYIEPKTIHAKIPDPPWKRKLRP